MTTSKQGEPGRRLHPISMVYFIVRSGKELAGMLPLIPVAILLVNRLFGEAVDRALLTAAVIAAAVVAIVLFAWLRWRHFRYRVEPGVLYIEQGLWVRRKTWIAKDRVQSIHASVSLYDRFFGLVRLEVETAGGDGKPEAALSSITAEEAARVQEALGFARGSARSSARDLAQGLTRDPAQDSARGSARSAAHQPDASIASAAPAEPSGHPVDADAANAGQPETASPSGPPMFKLPLGRSLALSVSTAKFALLWLTIGGTALKAWDEWLKKTALWEAVLDRLGWPTAIVLLLAGSCLLAAAAVFLLDGSFRLESQDGTLTIERGLLEKKRTVIAARRVQAVRVTENPLHRPFGLASVRIVVAGGSDEDKKTVDLFPLVRSAELPALLNAYLPDYRLPETWNPVGRGARAVYVTVPLLLCLIAAAAAIVWIPSAWSWFALLLPAAAWLNGTMELRQAAWSREERQLAIRFGGVSRQRVLIAKSRVQWQRISQNPLQEGKALATFKVALASGKSGAVFALRHAPTAEIRSLSDWLAEPAGRR
ncbi:membrane protein [Cohnella xylanilytica]|uniref:PH domain-containing protein n=1 Tax=Cohnella xylanilytica TaxID=557555 RepID=UPI001B267207|nr:PH domain-containing protein [Cohnella xylanilytica]GIO14786.1 membrane protein [Cohnella xylanilytica]